MDIKIVPCKEEHLENAIELTYIAWEPIFEGSGRLWEMKSSIFFIKIGKR